VVKHVDAAELRVVVAAVLAVAADAVLVAQRLLKLGAHPHWTGELAERRRARSVDHAGPEVEMHRAWYVLFA
jgi:hypothetical protein